MTTQRGIIGNVRSSRRLRLKLIGQHVRPPPHRNLSTSTPVAERSLS